MGQFVTGNGFTGTIGGNITVYGTAERQTITVADVAGTVTFDPSFNKGGDTIVLAKSAASYTIAQSGSTVVLSDGDSRIIIPVGTIANTIQFSDGDRTLLFSGGVKIGSQAVTTTAATITATGTTKSTLAADAATQAARLILSEERASVGGNVTVYGTAGVEGVSLLSGGNITFDPSFNKGGDTIVFAKSAESYSAQRSGSSVLIKDGVSTISIPVGTVGLTADFNSDKRTIVFSNGDFKVGKDVATTTFSNLSKVVLSSAILSAPIQIKGIVIERPFTVSNDVYRFDFSLDQFYLANGIFSITPSYFPVNGTDQTKYVPEFAYRLGAELTATKVASVISTQHPRDVVVADFNGDGVEDVYIADHGYDAQPFAGGQSKLLFGSASGFADATQSLPQKLEFNHSATAADIDKDGDIDIFVGNLAWQDSMKDPYFLINDGRGKFTERYIFEAGFNARRYTSSLLFDLDRDGSPELILGGDNAPSVIMKYVDGIFRLSQTLSGPTNRVKTSVLTGDLDGDGDIEIVFSSTSYDPFYEGTQIEIYEQNNGKFVLNETFSRTVVSETNWNKNLYLTDINRDGKLDLISTGRETKILLNDGASFVIDKTVLPLEQFVSVVEMWDINSDGRLDLVYTQRLPNSPPNIQSVGVFVMLG